MDREVQLIGWKSLTALYPALYPSRKSPIKSVNVFVSIQKPVELSLPQRFDFLPDVEDASSVLLVVPKSAVILLQTVVISV